MKDRRKKVMAPGIVADNERRRCGSDWLQRGVGDRRKMIRRKMDGGRRFNADPLGDDEGEME